MEICNYRISVSDNTKYIYIHPHASARHRSYCGVLWVVIGLSSQHNIAMPERIGLIIMAFAGRHRVVYVLGVLTFNMGRAGQLLLFC